MKHSEHEINKVIKDALNKSTAGISFESLWNMHGNRDKARSKYKRTALIPLIVVITLFTCFTISYAYSRISDNIDLPFVDDPSVIGNWETVDFVKDIRDFNPNKPFFDEDHFYLNGFVFVKDGKLISTFENSDISNPNVKWTKAVIIDQIDKTASKYEIKEIDGTKYLFVEWKSGDYIFRFMKPSFYVLKRVD